MSAGPLWFIQLRHSYEQINSCSNCKRFTHHLAQNSIYSSAVRDFQVHCDLEAQLFPEDHERVHGLLDVGALVTVGCQATITVA